MAIAHHLSLRSLMLGFITLATFSLTLPGLAWLVNLRTAQEQIEYAKQADRLMHGATPLLANALIVGDFATAEQTLAQLNRDGFFVRLKLLESDGRTLLMEVPRMPHGDETVPLWFDKLFGADLAPQQSAIQVGGQQYAVLFAQPDGVQVTQELWLEFRYLLLGTCVLNGLLLLVVGFVLNRGFGPIQQLGKTAERLGAGDLGARMPLTALPELRPTVQAFNGMADNIGKLMSEVHSQALSNRKLAALVAQTDEAILSLDNDLRISSWNFGAEQLLGYPAAEAMGRPLGDLVPHSLGLGSQQETCWKRKDGREVWVEVKLSPLLDEAQSLAGYILVARDMGHIKEAAAALLRAKEAAETANRMKGEFIANVSHEIRTPMNGIIGMTDLALETPLSTQQREYLTLVKTSADALLTVINDILDFSKIEAGRLEMERLPFNIRQVVGDTVKSQAIRLQGRPVELLFDVADDIPSTLVGDPGRLRQVLLNLLGNAIKFTERGEIIVHVDQAPGSPGAEAVSLQFTVQDTGIGIPAPKLATIFEPFIQADSSVSRRYGGTGLGLAITRRLVELMGGTVHADSLEGGGSVFTFSARLALGEAQPARTPSALEGLQILIIDDSESQRRIFKRALQRVGVRVDAFGKAESGLDALLQDQTKRYDALLLDVRGPDTDDFALVERIRAVPALKSMRIMVLATLGMRGDTAYCRKLGISAYLVKPTSPYEVLEALQRVMEQPLETGVEAPVVTRHNLHEGLAQETAPPQQEPEGPPGDAPVPGFAEAEKPLNILLAEDNPVNQKLACTILQRKGHHVVVAENGQIALETFRRLPFDLVLMDMQMPIMGGLEATLEIRALEGVRAVARPVVIAAMTANAFAGDRIACLEAGMDDYLSKPIRMADLERVLGGVSMGSYRA